MDFMQWQVGLSCIFGDFSPVTFPLNRVIIQ
jgi:hypothetical protein